MGRKRKHADGAGDTKRILPPCRVCQAPGAGFHYGANTCEACKGFFHRSLKLGGQYSCEADYCCDIEYGQEKLCQFCRYQKCLSVGMAKEAIKTGRYTSIKRTNDILEVKKLQEKTQNESTAPLSSQPLLDLPGAVSGDLQDDGEDGQRLTPCTNTRRHLASVSGTEGTPKASHVIAALGQLSCADISRQVTETQGHKYQICSSMAQLIQVDSLSHLSTLQGMESLSESPQECTDTKVKMQQQHQHLQQQQQQQQSQHHHHHQQQSQHLSTEMSPLSLASLDGSPAGDNTMKPSPSVLSETASSLLSLSSEGMHSPCSFTHSPLSRSYVHSPTISLVSSAAVTTSPALSVTTGLSSQSSLDIEMYMSNSPGSVCESVHDNNSQSVTDMYHDKELVVTILLDGNESFVVPLAGRMTEEEIKRQQQEHVDACRLQQEMFGQLRRLPDHEYDYIFATTGLDTDDRQQRLRIMGAGLEKVIRAMVNFCKVIPGFSKLDISDQVQLIKYSRQEFCLFIIYKFIDPEKKIMRGLDNQWKCEHEISRMSTTDSDSQMFVDNLDLHFRFCDSLQNLKLSDAELALIRAIIIMAPDRNPHTDSPTARDIYWQLHECLIYVLSKRYPKPMIIYAKIVAKLTEARSQTESMIRFFKRLKMDKYSNVMNNPLLREMCSGIFFDEKDDDIIPLGS